MFQVKINDLAWAKEIDRLEDGPTRKDLLRFEAVLAIQFQTTQKLVHVITRSLKLSGKVDSRFSDKKWVGVISYGGFSTGPKSFVKYAQYERHRHGHDYIMDPVMALQGRYLEALKEWLKG